MDEYLILQYSYICIDWINIMSHPSDLIKYRRSSMIMKPTNAFSFGNTLPNMLELDQGSVCFSVCVCACIYIYAFPKPLNKGARKVDRTEVILLVEYKYCVFLQNKGIDHIDFMFMLLSLYHYHYDSFRQ